MKNLVGKPYNKTECDRYDWSGLYPVVDERGVITEIAYADAAPEGAVLVNDMFLAKPQDAERLSQELLGRELDENTTEQIRGISKHYFVDTYGCPVHHHGWPEGERLCSCTPYWASEASIKAWDDHERARCAAHGGACAKKE